MGCPVLNGFTQWTVCKSSVKKICFIFMENCLFYDCQQKALFALFPKNPENNSYFYTCMSTFIEPWDAEIMVYSLKRSKRGFHFFAILKFPRERASVLTVVIFSRPTAVPVIMKN